MSDAAVRAQRLVCGYDGRARVRGVDFSIAPAEVLVIVGGSGSGKSTVLKTLAGLLPPIEGAVEMLGEDLYSLSGAGRRRLLRSVGVLFQADALFGSMTILENVCLPARELTDVPDPVVVELARARLSLVGILELADRNPGEVSGGQAKRAALARATVLDPEILFCDEPTAGLDPIAAADVDRTLLRLRDLVGTTVIAVTHDVTSVERIADRGILLGPEGVLVDERIDAFERSDHPFLEAFFDRSRRARSGTEAP